MWKEQRFVPSHPLGYFCQFLFQMKLCWDVFMLTRSGGSLALITKHANQQQKSLKISVR